MKRERLKNAETDKRIKKARRGASRGRTILRQASDLGASGKRWRGMMHRNLLSKLDSTIIARLVSRVECKRRDATRRNTAQHNESKKRVFAFRLGFAVERKEAARRLDGFSHGDLGGVSSYRAESAPPSFVPCSSFCVHHSPLRWFPPLPGFLSRFAFLARKRTPAYSHKLRIDARHQWTSHRCTASTYARPVLFHPFPLFVLPPCLSSSLASFFDPTRFVRIA